MILGDKKHNTLADANNWGAYIAKKTGWEYIGAVVTGDENSLSFTAQWRY